LKLFSSTFFIKGNDTYGYSINNEKIIVFGDNDVDGATSISIIVNFFKSFGLNIDWDLPIGDDLYGLNKDKIKK